MQRSKLLVCLPLLALLGACTTDPHAKAVRYVEQGNKFFEKEKYKEASIMYRRAVAQNADPLYGEAYYRLGLTYLKLASPSDAYQQFLRAVGLQKDNADALSKLADIELVASTQGTNAEQSKKLQGEAEDHAKQLLTLKDGGFDGNRLMGQLSLLRQESGKAIEYLEKANQIKPNQPGLILAYFTALAQDNQFPRAEQVARDLIAKEKTYSPMYDLLYAQYVTRKMLPEGEGVMREKVENNPTNVQYALQLATHYAATGQADKMHATLDLLNDKKYVQGHLAAGDFYYLRVREFPRAEQQYQAGIKDSPEEKSTYQKRLVELFAATNRLDQAKTQLQEVLKAKPDDEEAISMQAALRLTGGNREEIQMAVNDLQSLVTKTPNNHLLRFNLARALLAKGDAEAARLQLDEAVKLRDFAAAHEMLARIYLSRNEGAKALEQADKVVQLDPNNLAGHLARSSALLLLSERDKARQELALITEKFPQNADAKYQVGYLAYQDKDFSKATQIFQDLYKSNPRDLRGLVGVVETLAGQDKLPEAVKEMEAASVAEPNRQDLKVAVANLYVRSNRYEEAIGKYKEVLSKNPKDAGILYRLAETYRRKGDLNQAMDMFRQASQAAPNDPGPLLQLGLLMDGMGQREQSKPVYESILRIDQNNWVALNNLAYIKAEEGSDLDTALTMAQKAMQNKPDSPDIADTLGWVYLRKNLSLDAIKIFKDLVQKRPNHPGYRMHYGMALIQNGDRPGARRELETALRNNPSKEEASRINELLRSL